MRRQERLQYLGNWLIRLLVVWAALAQIAPTVFQVKQDTMTTYFSWALNPKIAWFIFALVVWWMLWRLDSHQARLECWFRDQEKKIHDQFNSQFQTLAQDTKNTRPDTVADVEKLLHRWDERIKKLESREPT